jgi:hypothetical protein
MKDELENNVGVIIVYFKCYSLGGTEENHKKKNLSQDSQLCLNLESRKYEARLPTTKKCWLL